MSSQPNSPKATKKQPKKYDTLEEWDHSSLMHSEVLRGVYAYGFENPSPIQQKGILPSYPVKSCSSYEICIMRVPSA